MSIITKIHRSHFTIVPNSTIKDPKLSWKAKGLLAYFLSQKDGWKFYEKEIVKNSRDSFDSLKSGIKELIDLGYLERTPIKNKGRFTEHQYDYIIYSTPKDSMEKDEDTADKGFPHHGKPDNGKPLPNNNKKENNTSNNELNNTSNKYKEKDKYKDRAVPALLDKITELESIIKSFNENTNSSNKDKVFNNNKSKGEKEVQLFNENDLVKNDNIPIARDLHLFTSKYKDFTAVKRFTQKVDNNGKWLIDKFNNTDWLMAFILTYNKYSDLAYEIPPQGSALNVLVTPFSAIMDKIPVENRQNVFEKLLYQIFQGNVVHKWQTGFVLAQFISEQNREKVLHWINHIIETDEYLKNNRILSLEEEKARVIRQAEYDKQPRDGIDFF